MERHEQGQEWPTKKGKMVARNFVLALLDKSQLKNYNLRNEAYKHELAYAWPFVRQSLRCDEGLSCERFGDEGNNKSPHYVIKYEKNQPPIRESEMLTDFLQDRSGREWQGPDFEDNSVRYCASALLIPIEDNKNLALAYLFGQWHDMINHEVVVAKFGVRVAASEGMSDDTSGEPLQSIKSATMGSYRDENATITTTKQCGKLGTFREVSKVPIDSSLEMLRLKPTKGKNTRLIKGKNTLHFFYKFQVKNTKEFVEILTKKPRYFYNLYKHFPVHKDFESYLESHVDPKNKTAQELNSKLDGSWEEYIQREIITEGDNLWSLVYRLPYNDQYEAKEHLKSAIRKGKSSDLVDIGNEQILLSNLIRVSCIRLEESDTYYRMQQGQWYEMARSMIVKMKNEITEKIISHEDLHLLAATNEKQDEGIYNELAVNEMNDPKHCGKLSARLLEKRMVNLREYNSFELADIMLLTNQESKRDPCCALIHVKKNKSHYIAHHCHQLTRSANFLSDNLNRTAVQKSFAKCFVDRLYIEFINKPNTKERFTFFQNKFNKKPLSQNTFDEMLHSYRKANTSKMVDAVLEIMTMIETWGEWKEIYESIIPYGDALYKWLDCMVDYLSAPKNPTTATDSRVERMRETIKRMLVELEENKLFTSCPYGILPGKKKDSITFVLAVITNRPPDKYLIDNKVALIHETMKAVEKCKFKFRITFIPVLDDKSQPLNEGSEQNGVENTTTPINETEILTTAGEIGQALAGHQATRKRKTLSGQKATKKRKSLTEQVAQKRKALAMAGESGQEGQQVAQKRMKVKKNLIEKENLAREGNLTEFKIPESPHISKNCDLGGDEPGVMLICEIINQKATNGSRQPQQNTVPADNNISEVLIANREENFTDTLEASSSTCQRFNGAAEENVGKVVLPKREGKPGGSPMSKKSLKKQKQAEEELNGRIFMEQWSGYKKEKSG